ncbi:MAG: hypothetical protein HZB92_00460 [Euryarchaeota archaeon]|nr:hypothetical protein [Euryarchaeota archaeon]
MKFIDTHSEKSRDRIKIIAIIIAIAIALSIISFDIWFTYTLTQRQKYIEMHCCAFIDLSNNSNVNIKIPVGPLLLSNETRIDIQTRNSNGSYSDWQLAPTNQYYLFSLDNTSWLSCNVTNTTLIRIGGFLLNSLPANLYQIGDGDKIKILLENNTTVNVKTSLLALFNYPEIVSFNPDLKKANYQGTERSLLTSGETKRWTYFSNDIFTDMSPVAISSGENILPLYRGDIYINTD